jgi:hypothetical protein
MAHLALAELIVEGAEQLSHYWDAKGLDMHIAVKQPTNENDTNKSKSVIAVSTKHWSRVHYINPQSSFTPENAWDALAALAQKIGRTLVISQKGPYVYIPKLSAAQTQNVFNYLKQEISNITGDDVKVTRVWEMSWDIDDAVPPPTF